MKIEIRSPAMVRIQKGEGKPIPIGLYDVLRLEKAEKRQIAIVREEGFRFPTNHENLIYRIASALHRLAPVRIGVRITIQKNIPPEKGLGSWVSASAQTMLALNKLWNLGFSKKRLLEIAKKVDPSIAKVLKGQFEVQKQWAIVAIPKLIQIDREWVAKKSIEERRSAESVAESHFPDLVMIREALEKMGWEPIGLSGMGPAIVGFSPKRIGIAKIPKNIRSKLEFAWIGKCL
jgi:4-diphosphocytidyl-2C-methyl-D-erythritol kinase